jgi:Holliday junction resolvase RusA-like endonuclease
MPFTVAVASRPRVTSRGVFYSKRYTEFKRKAVMWLRSKKMKMVPQYQSIFVYMKFGIPLSKTTRKKKDAEYLNGHPHTGVGDIDNMCKAVLDCMQGEIFDDDRYVYSVHCIKVWCNSDEGFIDIQISTDTDEDCPHTAR